MPAQLLAQLDTQSDTKLTPNQEPSVRVGLTTPALRKLCSTTELRRRRINNVKDQTRQAARLPALPSPLRPLGQEVQGRQGRQVEVPLLRTLGRPARRAGQVRGRNR